MKKLIVAVVVIIAALIAAAYIFVPNNISIKRSVIIHNNQQALYRTISDAQKWANWWPGKNNEAALLLNGNRYTAGEGSTNSVLINISNAADTVRSLCLFLPVAKDSVKLEWLGHVPTSYNPVKRLQIYFAAKGLQKDLDLVLSSIKAYYSTTASIYGLDIRREHVKDTSLVFTSAAFNTYPTTEEVYTLIGKLRAYISSHSAQATDSPMLNIQRHDSTHYITKVAIPVNRELPSTGDISYKWMLPNGKILSADVKGGAKSVDNAFMQVENYINDRNLSAPAIPFYSLIVNRLAEKDSSKWITRIYYPVIFY